MEKKPTIPPAGIVALVIIGLIFTAAVVMKFRGTSTEEVKNSQPTPAATAYQTPVTATPTAMPTVTPMASPIETQDANRAANTEINNNSFAPNTTPNNNAQRPTTNRDIETADSEKSRLGISIELLTPTLARRFQITAKQGLIVREVDPSGLAASKGIAVGDVILEVNRQRVVNLDDLVAILEKADSKPLLFLVERRGQTAFIAIPIE